MPARALEGNTLAGVTQPSRVSRTLARLLKPSLADWLGLALLAWLFAASPHGWESLLADGDTGWHIRTGQWILEHHRIPDTDLFSFSKPGQPWLAWEWLADVLFAAVYAWQGLAGVVALAALCIVTTFLLVAAHASWRRATGLVSLLVVLLAAGASTLHQLARPHVMSWVLLAAALWLLEADRNRPRRAVWSCVPLVVVWTNLHGGVLAFLACLALLVLGELWDVLWSRRRELWPQVRRHAWLLAACTAATLANPYGWRWHAHVYGYLGSTWIHRVVEEFGSPQFRNENVFQFELLLAGGLVTVPGLLRRGLWPDALWVLFWAHAALRSARHIPIYCIVVAPVVAAEVTRWLREWRPASWSNTAEEVAGALRAFSDDLGDELRRLSFWWPLLAAGLFLLPVMQWPRDFPEAKFPIAMARRHAELLASSRVFCPDEWADYLLFLNYPRQRVFVDGRSDFYGPDTGGDYIALMQGQSSWRRVLERYRINLVWVPRDWPLASLLRLTPGWEVIEEDSRSVLVRFVGQGSRGPNEGAVAVRKEERGSGE